MQKLNFEDQQRYIDSAVAMIQRGARTPVVKSLSSLSQSAIAKLYLEINGVNSPTGPLPSDPTWFTSPSVPIKLIDSSFFLGIYNATKDVSPDAIDSELLVQSFDVYVSHCAAQGRAPRLNINRAWALVRLEKMNEVELIECTCCGTPIVQQTFSLKSKFVCCICKRPNSLRPEVYRKSELQELSAEV